MERREAAIRVIQYSAQRTVVTADQIHLHWVEATPQAHISACERADRGLHFREPLGQAHSSTVSLRFP